ncbi:hypothetical protein M569_04960, partial [Genlisea aurea]
ISAGTPVILKELNPSWPNFKQGFSVRVIGKLVEYDVETAMAGIEDGDANLEVDTGHLSLNFRVGSLYQFIGELQIQPHRKVIVVARVGRIVDGLDMNLYHQSLQLLREFQARQ